MITPEEGERRANELVNAYITNAEPETATDVANLLMKLAGVAGLAMAAFVGPEEATERMQSCVTRVRAAKLSVTGGMMQVDASPPAH